MFYYYKKEQVKQGKLFCVYQSNAKLTEEEVNNINKIQNNLLQNTIVYESNYPFVGYPILEGDIIRPATVIELINLGVQELQDGEYIQENELIKINKPSWQHSWNKETNKWYPDENKLLDGEVIHNDKIVKVKYNKSLEYCTPKWDNGSKQWIDVSTQEEKLDFYKKRIIEINKELLAYEVSGFDNLELKKSLEKLINLHNNIAFDIATIQNAHII